MLKNEECFQLWQKSFLCEGSIEAMNEIMEQEEDLLLYDKVESVKSFCYFRNRRCASGESEGVSKNKN